MCFNKEVSLATWLIGMSGSAMLYKLDKLPEAVFFGTAIQMQLVEYFLWKNQPDCKEATCQLPAKHLCNDTNKTVTKVGTVINHMEPIMLFGGILLFSNKQLPLAIIIFMIIFIILSIGYTYNVFENAKNDEANGCSIVTEKSDPHLYWQWNYGEYSIIYYILFLLAIIILSIFGLEDGNFIASVTLGSYLTSSYIYMDTKSVGAMWCFIGAFLPWVLSMRTIYLNR